MDLSFHMQAQVLFARGGIETHLPAIRRFGRKALLVTGRSFAAASGLSASLIGLLDRHGVDCTVYDQVSPEPSVEDVEQGARVCRDQGCDCILAVGGGSAMDAGKAIAILARNPGRLQDYFGELEYQASPLPIIAIPTTCGTGSEVTRYAVIVDRQAHTKKTVISQQIIPVFSILDPEVLRTLPHFLVMATGMDAFAHSSESLLSRRADYLSRLFARESLKILFEFLPQAGRQPDNLTIKEQIFMASMLAGLAINKTGTIILHGMGYALTISHQIHHGTANALLLPHVFSHLKKNGYAEPISELETIWGKTENLIAFIENLGLPTRLQDIGIEAGELNELTHLCVAGTERARKNMRTRLDENDFRQILQQALMV